MRNRVERDGLGYRLDIPAAGVAIRADRLREASGEVTVELRVRADGSVVDAKVKKSSFVNIAFHDCLSDVARGWRFPAFVGDDDTVLHSFRFTPRP
jgi:TonB family protein